MIDENGTFQPKYSVEEQVRRFDLARLRRQEQSERRWNVAYATVAVAAVMGVALMLSGHHSFVTPQLIGAPTP